MVKEEKLLEERAWEARCAWLQAEKKRRMKGTYGFMWPMKEVCERAGEFLHRCDWRRRRAQEWVKQKALNLHP
jgi:hypothetical protein